MTYEATSQEIGTNLLRQAALPTPPDDAPRPREYHTLKLLALGTPYAIDSCRNRLYTLGYAQMIEWSRILPITKSGEIVRAARPDEVMRILTKRIPLPPQR